MNKELIEIYSKEADSFAVGFIVYENNKYLLINAVDDQGKYDGYLLFSKTFIEKIERNTAYLNKLIKYMDFWSNISIGKSDNDIYKNTPSFKDLISYAKENEKIISIGKSSEYFDFLTGYVSKIEAKGLMLDAIDTNTAEIYSSFYVNFDEIKVLEIDSIDSYLLKLTERG